MSYRDHYHYLPVIGVFIHPMGQSAKTAISAVVCPFDFADSPDRRIKISSGDSGVGLSSYII